MKQKDLTMLDIDNYIIERARSGAKQIIWGRNKGLKSFYMFANTFYKTTYKQLHGLTCMGLKHYIRGERMAKNKANNK